MIKKLSVAFVTLTAFSVNAQIASFKKELQRPASLTYYAINHLGDTSSIVDNEIAKETVLKTYTFKDPFLGTISEYDERNPLQQLVFYRNTQQLVLLDNQLSVKDKIILSEKFPELDAAYASLTAQSNLWIFDDASKRWCILNTLQNQPNFISNPLINYDFLTSYGNYAYWQSGNTVYGIDVYGKLIQEQILPTQAKLLAINGNKMLYQLNNTVFLFNTETQDTEVLNEVTATVEKAFFNGKNLSVLTSNKLFLYNIN